MWRPGVSQDDGRRVNCIACGDTVPRSEAREYDKEGDRWNRAGKKFEFLCADCHDGLSQQPRDGLENLLAAIEEDGQSREAFLRKYIGAVSESRERES